MQLFSDQQVCLQDIRQAYRDGSRSPLLCAPTGFGKTVLFSAIAQGAVAKGSVVWILVHRTELIDQVSETLENFGANHAKVSPSHWFEPRAQIQVASVFSLVRKMARMRAPQLIIVDEAHHVVPNSTWSKVLGEFKGARTLGVTATPVRLSGEGLGKTFDRLILGPSTQSLIDTGRLTPVKVFAPPIIDVTGVHSRMGDYVRGELESAVNKPKVTGDSIDHYNRLTPGRRAAVFCVSVDHARSMALAANAAGIAAVMIDGTMDRVLRRDVIRDFKNGKIKWLVSCDLISEGFDCPGIEVGISLRPTQSVGLWLQQCGRILRTAPGKSVAIILDHAGNALRHGLPTDDREWSLDGIEKKPKNSVVSVRVCPKCFSAQKSGRGVCGNCGFSFAVYSRTLISETGTLEEITPEKLAAVRARQAQGKSNTLEKLIELGRMRGMRNPEGWARHVWDARQMKSARAG